MLENWIFFISSLIKIGGVLGAVLFMVSYTVLAERWISAWIQDRIGPNRVGIPLTNIRLWGMGQPVADALKLLLKEEFTPAHVHKIYFHLAPVLAMTPALVVFSVIPFGSSIDLRPLAAWLGPFWGWTGQTIALFNIPAVIANLDIGLLFVFAIASLSVYGIALAGWASNSKYPLLGGIRGAAQMISYELCMGLAVVPVFLIVGEFNLSQIVQYQVHHGWLACPLFPFAVRNLLLWPPLLLSFFIFLVSAFAETNRLPFDFPECESELVSGYHTEYASMKFGLFFLGEYAAVIAASAMVVTVFLGGWSLPLPWFNGEAAPWWFGFVHIAVFVGKVAALVFVFIWLRWTLPRLRYDQLMGLGWKIFLPFALANIVLTALLIAAFHTL
ncbi:MAG: complex I subunit 1 family protein [bacterium]